MKDLTIRQEVYNELILKEIASIKRGYNKQVEALRSNNQPTPTPNPTPYGSDKEHLASIRRRNALFLFKQFIRRNASQTTTITILLSMSSIAISLIKTL